MQRIHQLFVMMLLAVIVYPWQCHADQTAEQPLSQQVLQQLVAPIALYPDPLLAQILMASTYPLEVVSAARWLKENPNLQGKALENALQQQTWDPSVKSLTAVPDVLYMMNDKLDMTTKLGDAFLAQQKDVLDAVQNLRAKAKSAGNLNSNKQQVVNDVQDNPQPSSQNIITIQSVEPQVVYVPTYDPNVVYGTWPYPDYPPYYYPYSGYAAGMALSFGAGILVGNALWGNFDWRNHDVNINVNEFNQFNRTHIDNPNWRHDPTHRDGVPYRDLASQEKYGKNQLQDNKARDAFRNEAAKGRQALERDNGDGFRDMERSGERAESGFRNDEQRLRDQTVRPDPQQRLSPDDRLLRHEDQRPFKAYEGMNHEGFQGGRGEFRGGEGGGFHGGRGGRR